MTTFETLEAKMASIEQSLSYGVSSGRRKGSSSSSMKNYPTHSLTPNSLQKISIQKGSLERLDRKQHDLKKVYGNSMEKIRNEIKSKKNSIANLKNALKKLTTQDGNDEMISDIDLRIRQAEIEFALGREEIELMELLSKFEEVKKMKLESDGFGSFDESLYGRVTKGEQFQICAVQATTGRWNANVAPDREGIYVDWVMDGEELQRGDLIIEINGKIISGHDKDELQKSCSNNPKCEMVVLRRKSDMKKTVAAANQMQTENLRLRHRISYLEEQVKELASNHKNETHITSISIQSQPSDDNRPLIYQRGSYVTTIPQKPAAAIQKSSSTTSVNMHHNNNNNNNNNINGQYHHSHHNHHHQQHQQSDLSLTPSSTKSSSMKALSASLSRISVSTDANLQKYRREKRDIKGGSGSYSQKSAKQNENIYVRQKHSKSLGYDTDSAATYYQSSEPISTIKIRQTPPTKPQRLSLQRTKSLQEVSDNVLSCPLSYDKKRALKRIHKFEPKI